MTRDIVSELMSWCDHDWEDVPASENAVMTRCPRELLEEAALQIKTMQDREPVLLTRAEAANYLGVSIPWMNSHRMDGPPYFKVSNAVRYSRADLYRWVESHKSDKGNDGVEYRLLDDNSIGGVRR